MVRTSSSDSWAVRRSPRRSRRAYSAAPHPALNTSGSTSKASRRRTASARSSGSSLLATSTDRPKRSRSWGRRSPSSGFIEPISTNRLGWDSEMPSRSMRFTPLAATSRSTSTRWSGRRFTSSTYSTPPSAAASRPGRSRAAPPVRAAWRSREPTTRSSVAPTGSSTNGAPSGSSAASPRARVDLALPFSPRSRTPLILGSRAFSRSASLTSSCPTTAEKGKRRSALTAPPPIPRPRAGRVARCRARRRRRPRGRVRGPRAVAPRSTAAPRGSTARRTCAPADRRCRRL